MKSIRQIIRESIEKIIQEKINDTSGALTPPKRNPYEDDEYPGVSGNLSSKTSGQKEAEVAIQGSQGSKKFSSSAGKDRKSDSSQSKKSDSNKEKVPQNSLDKNNNVEELDQDRIAFESKRDMTKQEAKEELENTADFFNNVIFPWADEGYPGELKPADYFRDYDLRKERFIVDMYPHPNGVDAVQVSFLYGFGPKCVIKKSGSKLVCIDTYSPLPEVEIIKSYRKLIKSADRLGVTLPFESQNDTLSWLQSLEKFHTSQR